MVWSSSLKLEDYMQDSVSLLDAQCGFRQDRGCNDALY
jgi:hypothetical protein